MKSPSPKAVPAIIPARGGSKGLPRKNVLQLDGKPLLTHTIDAALDARHVSRVVVTTDDAEIAQLARAAGAEVVHRPSELAADEASSEAALLHALATLDFPANDEPEAFAFLQCTSPLTEPADIDRLIEAVVEGGADSAFLATRFSHFVWRSDESGNFHGVNHDRDRRERRQDRPVEYLETGAGYAMKLSGFRKWRHRFFGHVVAVEMPMERAGEIDTPGEFKAIEARIRANRRSSTQQQLPNPVAGLVMDFDGVLSDDTVAVSEDGTESVRCSRSDGLGLELLLKDGLPMIVLSREANKVVRARTEKLRLECIHGLEHKLDTLKEWAVRNGIELARTVYVGNDINDLECMAAVGFPVAPADAHPAARGAAKLVLDHRGGRGAVRELCEMILAQRKGAV
jgi:YrbI family 3-deoxy-D-manno-octulosonate 8-phosphate phosphatase